MKTRKWWDANFSRPFYWVEDATRFGKRTAQQLTRGEDMKANFLDLHAAADFLGPGAVEVNRYQNEITDIVRRRGVFGQRIKQVPATGHPSRFFEEMAIASPTAAQAFVDPRNIVPTSQASNPRGTQCSAEGAGLADQLQPLRRGGWHTAEPIRLPPGEGSGRRSRWHLAHA
jgi:hypothetical protein